MNETMKKRDISWDVAKGIAIICVVFGHLIQYSVSPNYDFSNDLIFLFIYSFHIPLFFICSGFFFLNCTKLSFVELLAKKKKLIILPLLFGIISIILNKGICFEKGDFIDLIYNYWFLKALFLCIIVSWIVCRYVKSLPISLCILFLLAVIMPHRIFICMTSYVLPFFCVGIILKKYIFLGGKKSFLISSFLFVVLLLFYKFDYSIYRCHFVFLKITKSFDILFSLDNYWKYLYCFILGTSGSVCMLCIIKYFLKSGMKFRILPYIGKHTLFIYLIQGILIKYFNILLLGDMVDYYKKIFIYFPLVTFIIILIGMCLDYLTRIKNIANVRLKK